ELHTLGVDGGYTQQDVVEVARCFTGWTVAEPQRDPRYVFRPGMHDPGPKLVLGAVIAAGSEGDGDAVLDLLSHHPATAHFISKKLVRRFVSDDPPEALVQRAAETFSRTAGDIRAVLYTIFESPEFWSRRALRSKVKSPLELVAGSVRALGARVDDPMALARALGRIGQPLFAAQPPTGYPDDAAGWLSSGELPARPAEGWRGGGRHGRRRAVAWLHAPGAGRGQRSARAPESARLPLPARRDRRPGSGQPARRARLRAAPTDAGTARPGLGAEVGHRPGRAAGPRRSGFRAAPFASAAASALARGDAGLR